MNGRVLVFCLSTTQLLFGENLAAVGIIQKRLNLPFRTPITFSHERHGCLSPTTTDSFIL